MYCSRHNLQISVKVAGKTNGVAYLSRNAEEGKTMFAVLVQPHFPVRRPRRPRRRDLSTFRPFLLWDGNGLEERGGAGAGDALPTHWRGGKWTGEEKRGLERKKRSKFVNLMPTLPICGWISWGDSTIEFYLEVMEGTSNVTCLTPRQKFPHQFLQFVLMIVYIFETGLKSAVIKVFLSVVRNSFQFRN